MNTHFDYDSGSRLRSLIVRIHFDQSDIPFISEEEVGAAKTWKRKKKMR